MKNVVSKNGVWKTAPLNDIPSSGGGVLVVTDAEGTLDKTWQEIHDAMLSGGVAIQLTINEESVSTVWSVYENKGTYFVSCPNNATYSASSASSYPALV